ncbi:phage tail tape measure protein, partial [Bacillus thuringiensis]|nr:phage tail tape measure protein [Bacillus thuringiensis]MED2080163.1 phage tail tape measure protein [Bacillus thuringiensis]
AEAIRQRDEMGSLNAQEAEAVIAEAKRQYDSTVSTARDKHKEIVGEAKSQAGEHANQVDWETGQIKSKYQVMKDDVVQKMKETWSGITKWWEETKTSASNKVEEIKNTVSRKFEEKKKAVVDKMKEIKSDIEDKWNTVEKFFSTINLRSIGKSIIEGLEKGLDDATGGLYSKAKGIAGEIKKTISGALEINSPSKVMIPVGSAVPEGVGVGMDKGKRFVVDAAKNVVGTVKKQMGNMPSVFDFGFQTSHYSIPHNTLGDFNGYTQPQSPYNNAPTAKTMFSDRSGREQELNVTVNMTNVLDGKELANGSYAYTTKLQNRDQKRRAEF